jgi:hypothetical protein
MWLRSVVVLFLFFFLFSRDVFAIHQVGSCRLIFAQDPYKEGKKMLQELHKWGFIDLVRISPSLQALFAMTDNNWTEFKRWVDAKSAEQNEYRSFPFYQEYIQALILNKPEMAMYLVKSHLFETYEASTIHDLLDLALYFNDKPLIAELSRPRNFRLLQYRLDHILGIMSRFGSKTAVEALVAAGADINKLSPLGTSPLMMAIVGRNNDIVDFYLENPSLQINLKGNSFATALSLARVYGYEEIVEKIQEHPDLED